MPSYGSQIPDHIADPLRGGKAFQEPGYAVPVITVGPDGWPHVAMVSGVCLTATGEIRFPVRRESTTWRNLARHGKGTVLIAIDGLNCYIKGVTKLDSAEEMSSTYGIVSLRPVHVHEDASPAFHVEGLTFRRLQEDASETEERKVFDIICRQ